MNQLTKTQMCVQMRNGVEVWMDEDKARAFQDILDGISEHKFIRYEGQTINTADVSGVWNPETMGNLARRKNGEWTCDFGSWHKKREECACRPRVQTCGMCFVSPCICRD